MHLYVHHSVCVTVRVTAYRHSSRYP